MKKIIITLFSAALLMSSVFSHNLSAAAVTVGATTWYSWWNFDMKNSNTSDVDPTLLYGPVIAVKFSENYSFTFVYLYGKFDMTEEDSGIEYTNEMSRTDSDIVINYTLNSYFKIFAGIKYMAYKMPGFEHGGIGPGLGLSFVYPLSQNFFLLGNISGLYIWGKEDSGSDGEDSYNEPGANMGLSIAYYIPEASTTISLGARYQYFKTIYDKTDNHDITHQFYGVTLTATYSFNL
jgi:hypothetical protein